MSSAHPVQVELSYDNNAEEAERAAKKQADIAEMTRLCEENPTEVAERHAHLIWAVIRRMARRLPSYVQCEDLYGVGALGLMDAVEKYDGTKGTTFASYAAYRIRGAILDELRHRDPMPRVLRGKYKKAERTIAKLRHQLGREPSEQEVASALEIPLDRYQDFRVQVERATTVSYNEALGGYYGQGPSSTGGTATASEPSHAFSKEQDEDHYHGYEAFRTLLKREKLAKVAEMIRRFDERDQLIMALHYKEGLNFRQVGEVLGLTESRISQLHKGIILALRSQLVQD